MTENEHRPSPDLLLAEAKNENHGKLKIFLGAAPGVGKTYAMLSAAKSRLAEGVDVVIGIVETHRRSETEALAQGIPSIAMQKLDYRGIDFEEMDLDAILHRKPKLVLVDELAHTNIPGARHPKRYQDVQEILDAGIDVYSTLNVQHIESLKDIVARITGVTVRETVPDTIIQMAHAIELIDLPPDELLQRLKEGKVYIPEQARLAINRFFTPGNLTALRELALRQAAERVDDQMTSYMRRHSISGPWPTSNRVMVCISDDKQAASLVRTARRSAERRQAPWIVLHVETSSYSFAPESVRGEITQALELAESMGAETLTATGENVAQEIIRVAREHNVSTIIIGKSVRSTWSHLRHPSVSQAVIQQADGFDVLLVNHQETLKPIGVEARKASNAAVEEHLWHMNWLGCGKASVIMGLASLVAWIASHSIDAVFLPFIYMVALLFVVLDFGLSVSIFATFLGGIALDLLMTAPRFSLMPDKKEEFISLFFFLATGLMASLIGDRLHRQHKLTRRHAEQTQALYDFTKSIAAAATVHDVAQTTVRRVASVFGARVALLLAQNERLEIAAAVPAELHLDTASNAAMDWAWQHRKAAGWRSDTLPAAPFYGLPLLAGTHALGVLAIRFESGHALTPDQNHFLTSLAYQAANAIERARLVTDVAQARLQTETEKLRASLLSSISHDLRSPLDSIILTTQRLHKNWVVTTSFEQLAQIAHIEEEADKLDRFIENLLDMTNLVTGNMKFTRQLTDISVLVKQALHRLSRQTRNRKIVFNASDDLLLVEGDESALRRVFVNLIENACSYSPTECPIVITAQRKDQDVVITVTDKGDGIPEDERERVFDMFYRIKNGNLSESVNGAGLGLSICRGFVEAHHGTIAAQTGENGKGTQIMIRLPIKAVE